MGKVIVIRGIFRVRTLRTPKIPLIILASLHAASISLDSSLKRAERNKYKMKTTITFHICLLFHLLYALSKSQIKVGHSWTTSHPLIKKLGTLTIDTELPPIVIVHLTPPIQKGVVDKSHPTSIQYSIPTYPGTKLSLWVVSIIPIVYYTGT
jgi:hypothetical protein